jgi:predicted Zn-dependent protease
MAMRIQPNMYEAHFGLGEVFQRMGEPKNAIPELKMAERAQPSNPRPHYFLSQVYRMTGEKDLAAEEMASFQRLQALSGTEGADTGSGLVPID